MPTTRVRRIKVLFASLFVLLPLQLGAKYVGSEPWPGVFLPDFGSVPRMNGEFVIRKPDISVIFDDGRRASVEIAQLLEGLPSSHHATTMRFNFDPKMIRILGDKNRDAQASSDPIISANVVRWLKERLAAMYPGQVPVHMEIVWVSLMHRITDDGATTTVNPVDTLKIELQ